MVYLFQYTNEADNLTYFEYTVRLDGDAAGTKIVAKTRREAAKLYGLVLHHRGKLRALGDRPCVIQVEENIPNSNGQSFRAWNAGNKIYVECFIPSRRVSESISVSITLFIIIIL